MRDFIILQSFLRTGYKPVQGSPLMEPIYTPCLTMVCETPSSRGYGYIVFSIDHKNNCVVVYAVNKANFKTKDVDKVLTDICNVTKVVSDPNLVVSVPQNDLLFISKLDELFYSSKIAPFIYKPLKLADRDTNNISLNAYINSVGSLRDTLNNPTTLTDMLTPVVTRKWVSFKKDIDWNLFWNSNILSDEEKANCKMHCNLQVAFSNKDRDIRKIIERQFYIDYPSRNWVFNILHGVPGSGKTTMIMEDICALNNIPCLYINGDARASINKMIELVGPSKNAQGVVELSLEESVWAKCLKNNIPLVVFIDEIDTMNSLELKNLGTLVTSGKATINTHHYNNSGKSIYYFGAFNPGSVNASEFPDSFDDRLLWFSIPKVTQEERINYRIISSQSQLGIANKKSILDKYKKKLETIKAENSNLETQVNNLMLNFMSINLNRCTEKALKWYCDRAIDSLTNASVQEDYKPRVFTNKFADSTTTIDYTPEVDKRITLLFDKMNDKLADLTRGIQTTKRNRNSVITIPDRCYDVFKDLIFSYTSVAEAFKFIIMNRLPEGFVLNVPGAVTQAGKDTAPKAICDALYTYMEKDIEDLDTYLFKVSHNQAAEDCYDKHIVKLQHVVAPVSPAPDEIGPSTLSTIAESIKESSLSSTDEFDEWGDVADALASSKLPF